MSRSSFDHLLNIIHSDPIFLSTGRRPQRAVKYQLAIFLMRLRAETAMCVSTVASIAEGSIYTYVERVSQAFTHIRDEHLHWPGSLRRAAISERMAVRGFPGCIGVVDGSLIRLAEKPLNHGYNYWSRKKFYAVSRSLNLSLVLLTFHLACYSGSV
jgi:hypothetical protein